MKIHQISLHNYNQFRNLTIDLRYPFGHPKEGQPLEKVCFIGQSGTGKTSLLRLIKYFISDSPQIGTDVYLPEIEANAVKMIISFNNIRYLQSSAGNKPFMIENSQAVSVPPWGISDKRIAIEKNNNWYNNLLQHFKQYITENAPILLNFPTERLVNKFDTQSKKEKFQQAEDIDSIKKLLHQKTDTFIDFAFEDNSKSWDFVLSSIRNHRVEEMYWRTKISDVALNKASNVADIQKINAEYIDWLSKNPNPLETLANQLNGILAELGVKIKTDIDKESIQHQNDILLQTLEGVTLERNFWSTGTKQIVDTAMPLFEIKPKNAIILIDEPERSLYPNLQQKVVDFYTSLGTNCQFFFATHSPIIASAFDPWEIVELKFDDTNSYVEQELHYTGERHIDNYTVHPKYLKWDDILMKLFDLTEEGNSVERTPVLMRAAILRRELDSLKANGQNKDAAFMEKLNQYIKLQSKLGWDEKAE